ncbi:alpha/beta fold hydrolase [Nocardioides aurantiacus]|uniref:Poly(3-hydroxyalkanoate) depolymerase n=1 Tax=Nocardioides aurantiacus TaxID=86796 RepID=A0A3N2CYL2_9ACTN|nr:alpha/beta fold hydrolase [Nocardioides aurantiacus]ROR92284.1 poly(3-hydroxyalkanoate) depolymerase [Nocardioides aurantiacus]
MTAEPPQGASGDGDVMTPLRRDVVRQLTVRGITARVSVRPGVGSYASKPPLLLCNGIGVSLEALQPLVDQLHPDRGLVRFDVPGIGGSALPPTPYPIAALSSWVTALMAKLGHRRFDVFGLSWGGGLAQQLAVQSPRKVHRVVLVATGTGCLMVPASPRVLGIMSTPRRHRDPEYAARVAPEIYGGSMRTDPERGAALLHAATRSGPKRGYYYQLAAMAGWTSLPFLGLLRQPTLVMGGDDDPIIPAVNPRMQAAMIPRARLHLYHGGHLGILTEADELAPVIDAFLDEPDTLRRPA